MRISDWSSDVCSSDLVEFGACRLGRRTFQLTAGGHDVAPARGAYRRRNARLENQAAERAHPFGRRTFILSAGPGVEGDQIDLRVQAILLDQPDQLARILVAVILVFQHHIFEGDAPRIARPRIIGARSEEHTSELQSLMRRSYAVFCLNKKTQTSNTLSD